MKYRKLTALVATAAGALALTGSAHAAVIQNLWFEMYNDPAGEVSLSDGNLSVDWSHSSLSPELTGTLKVINGDDANFRVHVDSLDIANNVLGSTYYTPRPNGFKDDAEHDFAVDMAATAAPNVASVKIMLEKDSSGTWKEKDHAYMPVLTPKPDDVMILDKSIDVGGSSFDTTTHDPVDPATVSWDIAEDGQLTANYHGYLHLGSGFYPRIARVQIRALNNAGKVLDTDNSSEHYQLTPAYQAFEDELSVTTADATRVKVKIQEQDPVTGDWIDVPGDEQIVNVAA